MSTTILLACIIESLGPLPYITCVCYPLAMENNICLMCWKEYARKKPWQRFCSPHHRDAYHNAIKSKKRKALKESTKAA